MWTLIGIICIFIFRLFSWGIVQLNSEREMFVSANQTRHGRWILKSKRIIQSKYLHLGNINEQARQLQWIGLTWFGLVLIVIIAVITAWSRGWFRKKRNKKCLISRSYRMMIEQLRDMNIKLISHLEHQEMEQQQNQAEQMILHELLAQHEHVNSENFAIIAKENQELKEILQNLNVNLLQVHEVAHQHQQQNEDHKMKEQQFHEKQEETNKQCEKLARGNKDLNEEVQQLKSKLILLEEQQKQLDHENVQEHNLKMEESQHHNNSPGASRHCVDTPNQEGFHPRPDLLKLFGTLLNKMTPDNYHHLLAMIMALNITSTHFERMVQMIVCQAIAMPKHSAVYASLCQHLTKIEVPMGDTARTFETFQQILLKHCEEEYCKSLAGISCICDIKSVEASRLVNEDELCTLLISRKCSLGIIRFIGELYKLGAVNTNTIVHILAELLRDGRNQSVEYICCMLNTVGKELTSDLTDNVMDEYFHHLELILNEGKLSARILLILQRFVFHRKRNWVPLKQ